MVKKNKKLYILVLKEKQRGTVNFSLAYGKKKFLLDLGFISSGKYLSKFLFRILQVVVYNV